MEDNSKKLIAISILRYILIAIGGWLSARGITQEQARSILYPVVDEIVGAALVLIPALWGVKDTKTSSTARVVYNEVKEGNVEIKKTPTTSTTMSEIMDKMDQPEKPQ